MLKRNFKAYHNLYAIGNIIGEVYIHHIIHKDGYKFKYYMKKVEALYQLKVQNKITENEYYYWRARNIAVLIGKKLGIKTKNLSHVEQEKIKKYFLEEYVSKGYVSHSFPFGYFDSIMKNGLTPNANPKDEQLQDFEIIQDIFRT